jgi:hypothetical protein
VDYKWTILKGDQGPVFNIMGFPIGMKFAPRGEFGLQERTSSPKDIVHPFVHPHPPRAEHSLKNERENKGLLPHYLYNQKPLFIKIVLIRISKCYIILFISDFNLLCFLS